MGSSSPAGTPISATTAQSLSLAALSCPVSSGPRLAGQVMASSGFAPGATSADAGGLTGMSPAVFSSWAPWPKAEAQDQTADVYALAHYMCDISGQVRQSGVDGDAWSLTLAAYHSGVPAVTKAKGVPAAARDYVDRVSGYAAWYKDQDVFTGAAASPSASVTALSSADPAVKATSGSRMPEVALTAGVTAAGSICAAISPAQVAAELEAASAFDPNHRSDDGAMGVAGFDSDLWDQYAPADASPWDPDQAVPVLGKALCALVKTLKPMGGDGYANAVAAFRVGPTAVRQAGGVPAIPVVSDFVTRAVGLVSAYSGLKPAPTATPSSSAPSESASPSASASASPSPSTSPASTSPATPAVKPPTKYKIVNGYSHKVLATTDTAAGSVLVQEPDNGSAAEQFLLVADADGSVRIKNAADGLVLSPQHG